jgi:hypothetical protein
MFSSRRPSPARNIFRLLQKKLTPHPDPFAPLAVTTDGGMFSTETSTSGFA